VVAFETSYWAMLTKSQACYMKEPMMNWSDYLDANQSRFVDELLDFVRIPSVSTSENHVEDVVAAGN
tara:strand:- start:378 stop:578 length:201 start_codon:yes stop_codon:yes gene_type:complete